MKVFKNISCVIMVVIIVCGYYSLNKKFRRNMIPKKVEILDKNRKVINNLRYDYDCIVSHQWRLKRFIPSKTLVRNSKNDSIAYSIIDNYSCLVKRKVILDVKKIKGKYYIDGYFDMKEMLLPKQSSNQLNILLKLRNKKYSKKMVEFFLLPFVSFNALHNKNTINKEMLNIMPLAGNKEITKDKVLSPIAGNHNIFFNERCTMIMVKVNTNEVGTYSLVYEKLNR
ncbi:hypothetical protein MY04_05775 (plasmid) [Flammeovirga sp. MY04]|uniref:hypothetical protein n=1 Tax=Flammeovirga sp. MY04 TaxID=1191459 RepID=UPI0008060B8F|nr:hypothetical protein [Flammeovirga sp. MY04]ANQ52887.1 hypothetical protein MY04_05775 [Flammeovirga sp. MY04]